MKGNQRKESGALWSPAIPLAKGKNAIRNEVEYKVLFMKEGRGMIPSVDHVVDPGISFENYKYYLETLRKFILG